MYNKIAVPDGKNLTENAIFWWFSNKNFETQVVNDFTVRSYRNYRKPQQGTRNVFTFGGAKRSGSDRECKYFPIGMNAREPLWR